MYNRAFDLCGYLAILFPAICRAAPRPGSGDNDADVDWFAEYQRLAGQARRPLETLALIDQLKRRIHEASAIALFAAFGLPHNANMTRLAALDLISLETFHDMGKCALLMKQSTESISCLCSGTTSCIVS
jgi:hypothetical protein